MTAFTAELKLNIRRRFTDGFSVGYNIIFPIIMIILLGLLCRNYSYGIISSYHYYTVVTIPFCIVMAMITAAYGGKDDAYAKTAERVLLAPISIGAIVAAKIISCTIVIAICSILTYIGCSIILKMSMQSMGYIVLLFLTLSFCICAMGTFIGLGMKNFIFIKNIMNLPICLFAILAGTFFPIGTFHKGFQFIINLSPITWINRSIFLSLYDYDNSMISIICLTLTVAGIIFGILAVITFKKGEYISGSLPSYEE